MIRKLLLIFVGSLIFLTVHAADRTYYSTVIVEISQKSTGTGLVSGSIGSQPTSFSESQTVSQTSTQSAVFSFLLPSTDKHTYYLFTQTDLSSEFDSWEVLEGSGTIQDNILTINAGYNANSPTTVRVGAIFKERSEPIAISTNFPKIGSVSFKNPANNEVGKSLTVVAAYNRPSKWTSGDFLSVRSKSVKFDGWYNDNTGQCMSKDLQYTFTVEEPLNLEARFSYEPYITSTDGYYRVKSSFNSYYTGAGSFPSGSEKYLSIEGNYNIGFSNGRDITPCMWYSNEISDPSNILRITGSDYSAIDPNNYQSQKTILKSVDLAGQGTSTKKVTGTVFEIITTEQPGLYKLVYGSYALYNGYEGAEYPLGALTVSRNYSTGEEAMRSFDFLPIDEDHIDEYYFAAQPAEEMYFDGGYWTSMYAMFPFECYDEGVEAYYVHNIWNEGQEIGLAPAAELMKIEDGIVPSGMAVLLKCKELDPSKNRLLPLLNEPANPYVNHNLLKGSLQLNMNNKKDDTGKTMFDSNNMRVLSIVDGEIGFFSLEDNTLLTANKAYLDITGLDIRKSNIRLKTSGPTFVESISANNPEGDANAPVYNLQGIPVKNIVPGQIYIKNGKKFIAR